MKKFILPILVIGLIGVFIAKGKTNSTDVRTSMGQGALWSTEIENLDGSGNWTLYGNASIGGTLTQTGAAAFSGALTSGSNLTITDDDLIFGDGTAPSTTTTSGNSYGTLVYAYLGGSSDALEGSVLAATSTVVSGSGITVCVQPATQDLTSAIGIAAAAASTGSVVGMYINGYVLARTTGTVAVGNTLVPSNAAIGYLAADTTPTTGADMAVALSAGVTTGGLTRVLLYK